MAAVDVRCPSNPAKLLMRMYVGQTPGDGMVEVACVDCRSKARRDGMLLALVLHIYDGTGRHVDTVFVEPRRR